MDILVIGDIHSDIENIFELLDKVSMLNFDCIIYTGDFIDVGVETKGLTHADVAELVLEELASLKKPIFAIPGNHDKDVIAVLERRGVSIHKKGKMINGIGIYGFGGARTPFGTPLEPTESEIQEGLTAAYKQIENADVKIQVTHMPPLETKIDVTYTGAHVGSQAVRKFIEDKHPIVAIAAHIHEARGLDEIDGTKLINAGRFPEGYCGIVSIDKNGASTRIINLI